MHTISARGVEAPVPTQPAPSEPPRSNSKLVAIGILLVAVGAIATVWLTQLSRSTVPVLVLANNVAAHQVLTASDLTTVSISSTSGLAYVPASDLDGVVGLRMATAQTAGTLLAPGAISSADATPGPGESVVSVVVDSAYVPSELAPGQRIRLVATPRDGDAPPLRGSLATHVAEVFSITPNETTQQVSVQVLLPAETAAEVAGWAATNRVGILQDGVAP